MLRSNSQFFAAALSQCWLEGQAQEVRLPEEDPSNFNTYVLYLYSGTLACKGVGAQGSYNVLAELYALGTRLMDHVVKDLALDAMVATYEGERKGMTPVQNSIAYPQVRAINCIYNATIEGSPGRRMLVDIYVVHGHSEWAVFADEVDTEKPHPDFLLDLVKALLRKRPPPPEESPLLCLTAGSACTYHHHPPNTMCAARRRAVA